MTEIQLKNRGPIAEIILDGPESRNALDADNLRDIAAAVAKVAEAVPSVRVLLIRGEGKVFCSGRDIANVDVETDDAHAFLADIFAPVFQAIRALPIPVIAQVQGAALGLGYGVAAAADIIFAADDAKLALAAMGGGAYGWVGHQCSGTALGRSAGWSVGGGSGCCATLGPAVTMTKSSALRYLRIAWLTCSTVRAWTCSMKSSR